MSKTIEVGYWWATLFGWILISGFGVAIGFHRLISHNAFETFPWIKNLLAYLGCLGGQGSPIFWAALHLGAHHPFADTHKDLHSPVLGKWNSYLGWQIRLRPENVPFRAGAHLLKDTWLKFLHKNYERMVWFTILIVCIFNYKIGLMGIIVPMIISMHQENLVDLFCHLRSTGYRNFNTPDDSVNNVFLGIFAFGQGWHNNHHQYPRRYNFGGFRWFEFDVCALLILLIKKTNSKSGHLSKSEYADRKNELSL